MVHGGSSDDGSLMARIRRGAILTNKEAWQKCEYEAIEFR
jgi:hypothetical protein